MLAVHVDSRWVREYVGLTSYTYENEGAMYEEMTHVKASISKVNKDTLALGDGNIAYILVGQGFTCEDVRVAKMWEETKRLTIDATERRVDTYTKEILALSPQ